MSRAGSNAGRGFRYQDAVSAWLAVEIWAGRREPATLIPEGGDDVELRGEETSFIQIKSRREHLGKYTKGEAAGHIEDLWKRSLGSLQQPERLELVLEREVDDLDPLPGQPAYRSVQGLTKSKLSKFSKASDLFPKTSLIVSTKPREQTICLISNRQCCSSIAAEMCFAALLTRVGTLANDNGRLTSEGYQGLSVSDTETIIRDTLVAVDVDAIERAIREGVCESVDFLTPLDDPNFYLGVDVEPGHLAAGLVSERPGTSLALEKGIKERRAALIVGPSGAGKSALMWETANKLRHTVRWFRIRRMSAADIPSIRQLIRSYRASEDSPVGFVMDDVGRNGSESWEALIKEAMAVPGVVLLGSIREEDIVQIAERARAAEVRADPDDELAERLWRELREAKKTEWQGWREPWQKSDGLLLEYVHILTRGQRMRELLADQVAARIKDHERLLELEILRSGAWAGMANAEIDAPRLANALSVSEADLCRALLRLIHEHLIRSPSPGALAGLHQLRSEELWKLTHQMPLPTLEASFERTVASVPATDLEPLVTDALSTRRLPVPAVLNSLIVRLESDPDSRAFASALRGLGAGRISASVEEWLEATETKALPRMQVGTAAILGMADIDLGSLDIFPEVRAAADLFALIKDSPKDDPRRVLMDGMAQPILSTLITTADPASLDEILGALVGVPLSGAMRTALMQVPTSLLDADLHILGSVMGSLSTIDREVAIQWVDEVGQETFFARIEKETAWAGPVTTEDADDGVIVRCDFWYIADSVQGNPHEEVVNLCQLMMALCPSADISMSNAITACGELAGFSQLPLAEKRIPRANLPPPSVKNWNRRWRDQISRRVAAPTYSDYLARGVAILETLVPTLEKLFDAHLRGKNVPARLYEALNLLNSEVEALTPPAVSSLEASGGGSGDFGKTNAEFQNLLHNTSVNLINRFVKLPDQSGAYISWLNNLIDNVETVIADEPWQLIGDSPPPTLTRLKALLKSLRLLAGEAHERKEPPLATWIAYGKRARPDNALGFITSKAKPAGKKRLAKRKAGFEQAADKAGINAEFHLRTTVEHISPWPPADVLALLPTTDIVGAVHALAENAELLQSLVGSSTCLTVMPLIDRIALPALARSGHQTLLPDAKAAVVWAEQLGLPYAPSETAGLFGEVLSLSSGLFLALDSDTRLARTARSRRETSERRDDADGSGFRCFGRAAQAAREDCDQRQQPDEARAPGADHPSDGRRLGNDGGRGGRRRVEADGLALAEAVHGGGGRGPSSRQDAQVGDAAGARGEGPQAFGACAAPSAERGDALDGSRLGEGGRRLAGDGAPHPCPPPARAAQGAAVQGVDRSEVRGEDPRRHRVVHESAGPRGGSLDRREDADPGARADAESAADEAGTARDDDARLQAERNHDAVRRDEHSGRDGHRQPLRAPPASGVHRVPRAGRQGGARRAGYPRHPGQLLRPQAQSRRGLACGPSPLDPPLHADLLLLDERGRGLLREAGQPPSPARRPRFPRGSHGGDRRLHRASQREGGEAVQMDGQPGAADRRPSKRVSNG